MKYPNLNAELARQGVTITEVADHLGITIATMSNKKNGNYEFTLTQAKQIKAYLKTDIPLEELFEENEEAV